MNTITFENAKMLKTSAVFLMVSGILIGVTGFFGNNYASVFLGFSFSLLCVVCYFLIEFSKALLAKVLWGFVTPCLIFIAPCLFTLQQPVTVISYSFAYIGALMYSTYTFRGARERRYLWISVAISFICLMTYDRFMIEKSFMNSPYVRIFIDHYWYFKMYQAIHFISLIYLIYRIDANKMAIEESLQARILKLQKFVSNLINTSKNSLIYSGDLLKALKEVLLHTAQVLDVSRISVWEYNEEAQTIDLLVGYDLLQGNFFYNQVLKRVDYPVYFHSLLEEKLITADDAENDLRTSEFKHSYLKPLGIKSMMDSPFFIDGKFKGILCCEEQREKRSWDQMDQLFSVSISKMISISYYCTLRKSQYEQLMAANSRLLSKNKTIDEVNRKFKEMSTSLNDSLLDNVAEETMLQKMMEDMSYKNAHHIRGPLSRILGLVALYKTDPQESNKALYIAYIEQSAKELDAVISEINQLLAQGA